MNEERKEDLRDLPVEELERRLRETFFYTDRIDDTVYQELERLREALEEKQPLEYPHTPEESWALFLEANGEELDRICRERAQTAAAEKRRRGRALLRTVLIAAAVALLLAGAVLAAGPRLWVWVRGWNAPVSSSGGGETPKPIPAALMDLGITEPVYPAYLPEGFDLAEAYISQDPLLLSELYTRGDRFISITVTPVSGQSAYPQTGLPQEYLAGETAHYLFSNDGSITAVWYTENYFVSISGNITIRSIKRIIDSVYAG